jgi:hypothetical protein
MQKGDRMIAKILNYFRMLFKHRTHKRFIVKSGTFVLVLPGTDREQKVQMIDISLGGMAFIYQGSQEDLEQSGVLKVLADVPDLANVHFDTASDKPTPESPRSPEPFRRRGVRFKWMGVLEEAQLKSFINKFGIIEK